MTGAGTAHGERPAVAVIVPAREAAATLPEAVESALDQSGVVVAAVVVAVAPSADGTGAVAAGLAVRHPRVRVVPNPAGSAAAGLNLAIAATTAPVLARLDAHARFPDGYLARAAAVLDRTGAAVVGGRQVPVAGRSATGQATAAAMTSLLGSGGARYRVGGPPGPVDTVYLGVFRRAALEAVGGYDPTLSRNQDYDLCWRLRAGGHAVWFAPELHATYRPRATLASLAAQYWHYGRWKRAMIARHPRSVRPRQLLPPAVAGAVVAGTVAPLLGGRRRWGLLPAGYAATVALAARGSGRALPPAARRRLPAVLATMHLAWGAGFLAGPPRRPA